MAEYSHNEQNNEQEPLQQEHSVQGHSEQENLAQEQSDPTLLRQESTQAAKPYSYRWTYDDQRAFDQKREKKKRVGGVLVYAISMAAVFGVALLVLTATMLWSHFAPGTVGGDHAAIIAVAENVKPSTVLISAADGKGVVHYGTGFFLTDDGYIATNYHVVRDANVISIMLFSGETYQAETVGFYEPDDLAVLKIDGFLLPVAAIGDSSVLRVGELVVAIGNPSGAEAAWSTTHGIVSALDRRVVVETENFRGTVKMIQTDAPVNPGNSGGPLCNADGEVIGIITRKMTDYESIGFAIPINEAMQTLEAIMEGRLDSFTSSVSKERPLVGVTVQDIYEGEEYSVGVKTYTAPENGLLVIEVLEGGPSQGLLQEGDVLVEFDGMRIESIVQLSDCLYNYRKGDTVKIRLWRAGAEKEISVKLA